VGLASTPSDEGARVNEERDAIEATSVTLGFVCAQGLRVTDLVELGRLANRSEPRAYIRQLLRDQKEARDETRSGADTRASPRSPERPGGEPTVTWRKSPHPPDN
jgi:hypothetical protein